MKVVAYYSFNDGGQYINNHFKNSLDEIYSIISTVNALGCKTKESKEKTMPGKMLFDPHRLNLAFKKGFASCGWKNHKENCSYIYGTHLDGYIPPTTKSNIPPIS